MKNFFKNALIILLLGIVIASFAGSKGTSGNSTLTSVIEQFEDDIANGSVIKDGIINSANSSAGAEIEATSNFLASLFNKIGTFLIGGIGKLLKLIAELITRFIG